MKKHKEIPRRVFFIRLAAAAGLAFLLINCGVSSVEERPNILFIIVDDLRPELGCFGNTEIKTPHIDQLAQEALTRVWSLGEKFREINPEAVTMPQHFSKFGYYTVSIGKIFHNHMPDHISFDEPDLRPEAYNTPELIDRDPETFYHDDELKEEHALVRAERIKKNPNAYAGGWAYGRSTESFDAPDNAFYDGAQTEVALDTLERIKDKDQPFFLALGYYRPHLPFVAPKKYWDLYDRDKISPAKNPYLPKDSPIMAINSMYELRACYDLEFVKHPSVYQLPEETASLLKHGYYASVSFIDACIGKLMDGLRELGLDKNTIVVIWGDHGWKLGEHGSWCKQTNYNIDTRVPLLIRAPGIGGKGAKTDSLTELVDLYPTLCDLAGIEVPDAMEGTSLRPLLEQPDRDLKSAAFSQYVRRPKNSPDGKRYMGYSMVTSRYHYVEWCHWDDATKTAGDLVAVELYDLLSDPDENTNIAGHPENAGTVRGLAEKLKAGWRVAPH
jgi:arylsulfatase A-like enzyme